jgi:hypothetical protein
MPPFAGNAVGASENALPDGDAAADASAENHAEDHFCPLAGAVDGFRKGKAVGVVGQANIALQQRLQILAQPLADQAGRVGVLDPPVNGRFGAGRPDADAAALAKLAFRRFDQLADRPQRTVVIALRCRTAPPQQDPARAVERDQFNLAAAKVYPNP